MTKVYTLKYYYNEYEQLGGYTLAIFKDKPSFATLDKFFSQEIISHTDDNMFLVYGLGISSENKTRNACLGMLSRGEEVHQFGKGGGDMWKIEEGVLL